MPVSFEFPYYWQITAKSPVFTHISATLRGLITIRAFEAEEVLTEEFDEHQVSNNHKSVM